MLVHGSEETKPFQCDICFKRFLNNSALSCHVKTHNGRLGVKKYLQLFTYYNYLFSRKFSFLFLTDKKSFECPLCKKEFEQVFGLKEHVKSHSADGFFTCPHCNKVMR